MGQYLRIFKNHKEYVDDDNKPIISHCIQEVHIHYNKGYYPGSDDGYPEGDYDLDAGYFF